MNAETSNATQVIHTPKKSRLEPEIPQKRKLLTVLAPVGEVMVVKERSSVVKGVQVDDNKKW